MSDPATYICANCECEGRGTAAFCPPDWAWHGSKLICGDCETVAAFGKPMTSDTGPVWMGLDLAKADAEEMVWIWSGEHGCYWRPDAEGYTSRASAAGIYTRTEAERLTSHCGPEKRITLETVRFAFSARAGAAA